jgi:hypothetical protein
LPLQLDERGLGEAGTDPAGEAQSTVGVVHGQGERADGAGAAAFAGLEADDDDFLSVVDRCLDPVR